MALIPANNPMALSGYYVGFLALIPVLGCLAGPLAIVLSILGIINANKQPEIAGKGHAIVGIILGAIGTLLCGPFGAFMLLAAVAGR